MTESDYKTIADHIRYYRLLNNYTQEEMAWRLQIDAQYYAQLEQGRRHFTIERIIDFCTILNIPIEKVIVLPDNAADTEQLRKDLKCLIDKATYNDLCNLMNFAKYIMAK